MWLLKNEGPSGSETGTEKFSLNKLQEINLMDHPFKREMLAKSEQGCGDFDYHYFDDPQAVTGFRGYELEGNIAEGRRDFVKEAQDIARIPGIKTVLDVGCAKGFLVKALRNLGIEAYGIDISQYAIENASPEVRPYLRQMRVQELKEGECYDIVHVSGVLIYLTLTELLAVLRCFHKIAKIGVLIFEPTREEFQKWFDNRDVGAIDPLRKQELSQREWEFLLESAGFFKSKLWYTSQIV